MTEAASSEVIVGEAVQWWLEKEAGHSTFDQNKGLDNLLVARQAILKGADPKIQGHLGRMELWLSTYDEAGLRSSHAEQLAANVAFGAMMFLSGAYRRQRYLQSANQSDYFQRKSGWYHPGGVVIPEFLPPRLLQVEESGVEVKDVKFQGFASIILTENSIRTMYERAPADFGQDESLSVDEIRLEQISWLTFLSRALRCASHAFSLPMEHTPILEPKPRTEAGLTTLSEVLTTKS
jgi:hypothetical protein